ncbi:MAG: hypothetical protein ACR2GY_11275 [Phycisphaerales bacterium]
MPPLVDSELRRAYLAALSRWSITGYVNFLERPAAWVHESLGMSPRYVAELMYKFVNDGGTINQVVERRPEYTEQDFHYDLLVRIHGRLIYIETLLDARRPDDEVITVVSIHDAR